MVLEVVREEGGVVVSCVKGEVWRSRWLYQGRGKRRFFVVKDDLRREGGCWVGDWKLV